METVRLRYSPADDLWRALWPVPWNAPDGEYQVHLDTSTLTASLPRVRSRPVKVVSRPLRPLPPGFGVLTLESIGTLARIPTPSGGQGDILALTDWAEFIGADALCVQGGESSGYDKRLPDDFPWHIQSIKTLRRLGEACRRRGLKLGVYAMCYLVGGPPEHSPRYEYGWNYDQGRLIHGLEMRKRRGISIADPKRPGDIVKLLSRWRDMPEVDFVGLDYIRPVFGGYELVDDFVREMGVNTPEGWDRLSSKDRMLWLVRQRTSGAERNHALNELWYWYRAHRSARVVRAIKAGVGDEKPLWAFNLSWEKGWHHGQDPIMMRDAGIDRDAIMLYEADSEQFESFVEQWRKYVRQSQVNLLVGDAIDWVLHQRTLHPSGPEDFYNRNLLAAREFHVDGPVRGIFIHDFLRAWKGRRGPYSMQEWMLAGGAALTTLRGLHGTLPYDLSLVLPEAAPPHRVHTGFLSFGKTPSREPVTVELFSAPDVDVRPRQLELSSENPSASFEYRWAPDAQSAARGHRSFVAARAWRKDRPSERCQIHIMYFEGQTRHIAPKKPEPVSGDGDAPWDIPKIAPAVLEDTREAFDLDRPAGEPLDVPGRKASGRGR